MAAKMPLLVTSQASSSATTHKVYLSLLRRLKAFHWRQNRFEILQHIKNSREGFRPTPPHSLYHGRGMNLRVRPRVKHYRLETLVFNVLMLCIFLLSVHDNFFFGLRQPHASEIFLKICGHVILYSTIFCLYSLFRVKRYERESLKFPPVRRTHLRIYIWLDGRVKGKEKNKMILEEEIKVWKIWGVFHLIPASSVTLISFVFSYWIFTRLEKITKRNYSC